jgi:adenylate cyclase
MGVEIERKFLVQGDAWRRDDDGKPLVGVRFRQGYLAEGQATVRVRLEGERARLTIKGKNQGLTRQEFEYDIPPLDAQQLLDTLCMHPLIEKTRYCRTDHGLVWEIDVFEGENSGLIVAEVELTAEDQALVVPVWVGQEVSADPRYYNVNLVSHPFARWLDQDSNQ